MNIGFKVSGKYYNDPKSLYRRLVKLDRTKGISVNSRFLYSDNKNLYHVIRKEKCVKKFCEISFIESVLPFKKMKYICIRIKQTGLEISEQEYGTENNFIIIYSHGLVCGVRIYDYCFVDSDKLPKNILNDIYVKIAQTNYAIKDNFIQNLRPSFPLPSKYSSYKKIFFDEVEVDCLLIIKKNYDRNFIISAENNEIKIIASFKDIDYQRCKFSGCGRKKFKSIFMKYSCNTNYPMRISMRVKKGILSIYVDY